MNYYVATPDCVVSGADSAVSFIDLSGLTEQCFNFEISPFLKAGGKDVVTRILINATAATGIVKTTLIDGVTNVFVSAAGEIRGSSKKAKSQGKSLCLADSAIAPGNVAAYMGNGSKGKLTVIGQNSSSGAAVSEICDIWISDAGQVVTKVV